MRTEDHDENLRQAYEEIIEEGNKNPKECAKHLTRLRQLILKEGIPPDQVIIINVINNKEKQEIKERNEIKEIERTKMKYKKYKK